MRPSFAHQQAPLIVDVVKEQTARAAVTDD